MDADIRHTIQAEVQLAVQNSQSNLVNSLTALLNNRLEGFNKHLEASQKALADTQMAKTDETLSDNYRFKKRVNEEQHKLLHNNKVMVKLGEGLSTETWNRQMTRYAKVWS